jgi:Ca2+-binding EF-hand superfamily protein
MKKVFLLAISLVVLALVVNVYSAGKDFENIDTNRDGKIDLKEFTDAASQKFKQYDKNNDGCLDREEFKVMKDVNAGREFEYMDTNKDGKVDLKEFTDAGTERFKLFDKNQDGYLNNQEFHSKQAYPILKFYF